MIKTFRDCVVDLSRIEALTEERLGGGGRLTRIHLMGGSVVKTEELRRIVLEEWESHKDNQ